MAVLRPESLGFLGMFLLGISGRVHSHGRWHNQQYFPSTGGQFYQQYPRQSNFGPSPSQSPRVEFVEGTIDQLDQIEAKWICTNPKTGDQMIFGTEIDSRFGNSNNNNNNNNNNAQQPQNLPTTNQWNVQQPYNPQQQIPGYNYPQRQFPGYNNPQQQFPGYNPQQFPGYNNQQQQFPGYNNQQQFPVYNNQQQLPGYNNQQQLPGYNNQQQITPNPQEVDKQTQRPQNPFLYPTAPITSTESGTHIPTLSVLTTTGESLTKLDDIDWMSYVSTTTTKPDSSTSPTTVIEYDGQGIIEPRIG